MSEIKPVEVQLTFRDADQSNKGAKMSAEEFVAQAPNVHNYGIKRMQTTGGTFWAEPARNGRIPEDFNRTIGNHFGSGDLVLSALYRSQCGLSMSPQSLSSHRRTLQVLAEEGKVNVIKNFHGMNDHELTGFLPPICKELGMTPVAYLSMEYKKNTMRDYDKIRDRLLIDLDAMLGQGFTAYGIKNANGKMGERGAGRTETRDFTERLFHDIRQRFGHEHDMYFHTHNGYGLGIEAYKAAIRGNEGKGTLIVDLLPQAIADGTAQASLDMFYRELQLSKEPLLQASLPRGINFDAIRKDAEIQSRLRGTYRGNEMEYDPLVINEAFGADAAGGSIGVLKGKPGTRATLERVLKTPHWPTQRSALYGIAPEVNHMLGYFDHVTPYQNIQDDACVQAVQSAKSGKDIRDGMLLLPSVRQYAIGALGRVSPDIDPELQFKALTAERKIPALFLKTDQQLGSMTPWDREDYYRRMNSRYTVKAKKVEELPDGLEAARQFLEKQSYTDKNGKAVALTEPTEQEAHIFAMIGNAWKPDCPAKALIVGMRNGTLQPKGTPELPVNLAEGGRLAPVAGQIFQVAYNTLAIQKLRDGFHQGLEATDNHIAQLEHENARLMNEEIPRVLKENGVRGNALGRALYSANVVLADICSGENGLGVREAICPQVNLDYKFTTKDDLAGVFGMDNVSSAASCILNGEKTELVSLFDQVSEKIEGAGLLPVQKQAAVEHFNSLVKAEVVRQGNSHAPSDVPKLDLQDTARRRYEAEQAAIATAAQEDDGMVAAPA